MKYLSCSRYLCWSHAWYMIFLMKYHQYRTYIEKMKIQIFCFFMKYIFQNYINACILNKNIIIFLKIFLNLTQIEGIKLKVIYWKDSFDWDLKLYFQKLNFTKKKKHYIFWKWFQNYHILINVFLFKEKWDFCQNSFVFVEMNVSQLCNAGDWRRCKQDNFLDFKEVVVMDCGNTWSVGRESREREISKAWVVGHEHDGIEEQIF